jgi:ADP-ribose pyrophosphatase YjhB (NUDIX family)
MDAPIDVTVAAIVARKDRFLVVEEQAAGEIVFNQPAGHLETAETLLDAVVRETHEETGYHFTPQALVGIYLWHCEEANRSFLRVTFAGTAREPETPAKLDTGIVAVHWLTRGQLLHPTRRLRSPMVIRCIDDFSVGRRFPLQCLAHLGPEVVAAKRA